MAPLVDGGALVIPTNGGAIERWDPRTGRWHPAASFNADRIDFAAVPLLDGRVLVAGGDSTGAAGAYSSAYAYDPSTPTGAWVKVGLMDTARAEPAAALLEDGRVLVAGGAYHAPLARQPLGDPDARLAAYRPGPDDASALPFMDSTPPHQFEYQLATAEIFDPTTGRWSPTGPMHSARVGANAVTLSDGRVLVVGGRNWDPSWGWPERMLVSAELFDPTTGTFSPAGSLPDIDRAEIAASGVTLPVSRPERVSEPGTLVALPDGDALLVGRQEDWGNATTLTRSFRFDAGARRWTQEWPAFVRGRTQSGPVASSPGVNLAGAFVVELRDGSVFTAGGTWDVSGQGMVATSSARLYDPVERTWSSLPPMDVGRAGGGTAALADGSVLVVGGAWNEKTCLRFVPVP